MISLEIQQEKYSKVVNLILNDTTDYPYKSDKIKVLLELELDVDTSLFLHRHKISDV